MATATIREVRELAAEHAERGMRLLVALDRAASDLGGNPDLFHGAAEAVRSELTVGSLAQWAEGRSQCEVVAALRGEGA